MTFDEVRQSPFRPFGDFLSIQDALEREIIPRQYDKVFDRHCKCGSERMVRISKNSKSVTGIACCDSHCPLKITYQLDEIFQRFHFKGIGPALCFRVVSYFSERKDQLKVSDILMESGVYNDLSGAEELAWESGLEAIKNSKQTMGKFIYKLSYPGLGSKFEDVFRGISSVDQMIEALQKEGFKNFFINRGIKSDTVIYYVSQYLIEIVDLLEFYSQSITNSAEKVFTVCMTGRMDTAYGKFTKDQFIQQCIALLECNKLDTFFSLEQVSSVSKAEFVVAGTDSVAENTVKYRDALKKQERIRQESGNTDFKILFSPDEFFTLIQKGG